MAPISDDRKRLEIVEEITRRLVEALQRRLGEKLVAVILYGSYARGQSGPDSDVDLLVVLPIVADKRQAAIEIRRALSEFPLAKDIIVTSPDEIARRGDLVGTVLRSALREGKTVYERT